ncbi:hypothetical protein EVAR_100867_1, partial [Eumeta japonica]
CNIRERLKTQRLEKRVDDAGNEGVIVGFARTAGRRRGAGRPCPIAVSYRVARRLFHFPGRGGPCTVTAALAFIRIYWPSSRAAHATFSSTSLLYIYFGLLRLIAARIPRTTRSAVHAAPSLLHGRLCVQRVNVLGATNVRLLACAT